MDQPGSIEIRNQFKPGYLGQLIALHGTLYNEAIGIDLSFEGFVAEELSQFARRRHPKERIWLLVEKGTVKGSVAVVEESPDLARLRWYILHPGLRGQGWAKRLLDLAIGFAREQGFSEMMLYTLNELKAAKKRYEEAGLRLASTEEKWLWGKPVVEEIYRMRL
ncbi:MAG: GNAT family N-acetyltransferase [Haliscomenobacter sp.]|nr:GNAT family N-acetyltransferase [Haliscomenobacter sp.]